MLLKNKVAHIVANLKGPIVCTAMAPDELVKTKGVIVNTSFIVGLSPINYDQFDKNLKIMMML